MLIKNNCQQNQIFEYSNMVQSSKSTPEVNLFDTITSDLKSYEVMQKQAQFNDLKESISKVLLGDISNFYRDDFRFKDAEEQKGPLPVEDLGPLIKVDEMQDFIPHGAILSTKQRCVIAQLPIKTGTIICEADPILAIVDKQNITKYCSWCFKSHNPKPPADKQKEYDSDPDSFVPTVSLRSCSRCHFTHYCSQDCQRAHWSDHKPECNATVLNAMPTSLRLLLQMMRLKTDTSRKDHAENLKLFNEKVLNMTSMAANIAIEMDDNKLTTYCMLVFLRCPDMNVNIDNVKLILHVFSILEVNAFGISDKTLLRAGTGLYSPTNLFNHSCRPNCVAVFRGRTQFLVPVRDIEPGEELTISYTDQGVQDVSTRKLVLNQEYYFVCICKRCAEEEKTYDPRIKYLHNLERHSQLEQLDRAALAKEHEEGKLDEALKAVFLILEGIKTNQDDSQAKINAANQALKQNPGEITNDPDNIQDYMLSIYSLKLKKDFLERAVFLAVRLGDFTQASVYQSQIVDLNKQMYDDGCHPLQPMQLYQLGKLQAQIDPKSIAIAIQNMTLALDNLEKFFGPSSKRDGKRICQELLDEVKHNIHANQLILQQIQSK